MQPPISEQDIPNLTTQANQTFHQIQYRPIPLPNVLAGATEHPWQPDPTYHQHVPCLIS